MGNYWPNHPKLAELTQAVLKHRGTGCVAEGGLGKSSMAVWLLAQQNITTHFAGGSTVLTLGPEQTGVEACKNALRQLLRDKMAIPTEQVETRLTSQDQTLNVWQAFNYDDPVLLVLDDVWCPTALEHILNHLPPTTHVLVTCRDNNLLNNLGETIRLDFLTDAEGTELFFDQKTDDQKQALNGCSNRINQLVNRVYGHPGCIVALAGLIDTPEDLTDRLAELDRVGLTQQPAQSTKPNQAQLKTTTQAVFNLSWQALETNQQTMLARLCQLPAHLHLTRQDIIELMPNTKQTTIDALKRLTQLCLLNTTTQQTEAEESKTLYSVTDWTHELAQEPTPPVSFSPEDDLAFAEKLNQLGLHNYEAAHYGAAELLFDKAKSIREKHLGENHPDIANSLNNLASLYKATGRYQQAEPLYKRALAITEAKLGKDHPSTAISLGNLAELYRDIGQYAEAEPLLKQALAIKEVQLGKDHPDTAVSLGNLALLYHTTGRYDQAEPLYKRALAIHEAQLHPDTAISLGNLAGLYYATGRYDQAEPLYKQALAITEAQRGQDHPSTATSLNNLAELYKATGRTNQAEPLLKQALTINEAQLGKDHPSTAISLGNLAELYKATGRTNQAEPLLKQALTINEAQLGKDHPSTATSLNNLAGLYQATRRLVQAEPLYERALAIREAKLGKDHPSTAISLNNLAGLYQATGRYAEAEPLYERALTINEAQLGKDHPSTAISLGNLAELYKATGRTK
jgi:tetratricopeptide (TPR) repeat protein